MAKATKPSGNWQRGKKELVGNGELNADLVWELAMARVASGPDVSLQDALAWAAGELHAWEGGVVGEAQETHTHPDGPAGAAKRRWVDTTTFEMNENFTEVKFATTREHK